MLKRGQDLIVQVSKEPISTKGPRVTAQVSLAGRFLVYMPFASRVGVSRKIGEREERQAAPRAGRRQCCPTDSGGVIVRTVGEDVTQETFERELTTLMNAVEADQAEDALRARAGARAPRDDASRAASSATSSARRSSASRSTRSRSTTRSSSTSRGSRRAASSASSSTRTRCRCSTRPSIEPEIRDLFKRRCDLPSGGYLIIEPTEALVSIDVNSGRYTGKKDPEKTILKTNIEAAREIARQLRLRDVGGIIVCDFIDMETKANRDKVLQELRTHLGRDRARTKAFAVSELGLIEMTRQRVRQSHLQSMTEACPTCARHRPRLHRRRRSLRRVERSRASAWASRGRRTRCS